MAEDCLDRSWTSFCSYSVCSCWSNKPANHGWDSSTWQHHAHSSKGMLWLPFQWNCLAVVFIHRPNVMDNRKRCEGWARRSEFLWMERLFTHETGFQTSTIWRTCCRGRNAIVVLHPNSSWGGFIQRRNWVNCGLGQGSRVTIVSMSGTIHACKEHEKT